MDRSDKLIEICKGIRCLDNDSVNTTIEFIESSSAMEQRQLVRTLIRQGYTSQQIFSEVNRVFGSQAILKIYAPDVRDPTPIQMGIFISITLIPLYKISKFFLRR